MLADDYRDELSAQLAQTECLVAVPRKLKRLFEARGRVASAFDERRRFVRFACPARALVEIGPTVKRIPRATRLYSVLVTDLSREGVAFLHSEELFPGEAPVVWFPSGKIACRVARCLRHDQRCFEVGTTFLPGPQTPAWLRQMNHELAPDRASH